jgi:Ser-tRNA(Ala) deacylase AlaX
MATLRKIFSDFQPKGITIEDNYSFSTIKFVTRQKFTKDLLQKITEIANQAVNQNYKVMIKLYGNIEEASLDNGDYFRVNPDLHLKGKIRVISIENFDANPCSGTHLSSLSEINAVRIEQITSSNNEQEYELRYVVS